MYILVIIQLIPTQKHCFCGVFGVFCGVFGVFWCVLWCFGVFWWYFGVFWWYFGGICVCVHTYVHTYVCAHMYVYMYVYMYVPWCTVPVAAVPGQYMVNSGPVLVTWTP